MKIKREMKKPKDLARRKLFAGTEVYQIKKGVRYENNFENPTNIEKWPYTPSIPHFFLLFTIISAFPSASKCETIDLPQYKAIPPKNRGILDEGVRILQEYLQIDTTNPPGNEMRTIAFLKKILDREGIENQVFDLGNNRGNLLAVLKGDGTKKGIVLLHHMDVVPAEAKYWTVPPFSGKIVDGKFIGRGAIDIKGKGIVDLMTLIYIKRNKIPLKRDLVFLAVADEEEGSIGSRWMVNNPPDVLKNAEFLVDEGAGVKSDDKGNIVAYTVSIGEKSPLWLTLTFTGNPGHGSIPIPDSSVNRAIRAAYKILNHPMEFKVLPELKEALKDSLDGLDLTKITGWTGDLDSSLENQVFLEEIAKDPDINAAIRNTISITMLKGSDKVNNIPNTASISLDCRLLPGEDKDEFIEKLKQIVGDDNMTIKIEQYNKTLYSPVDTDFVRTIRKCAEKRDPGKKVTPLVLLCSTDSSFYRTLGINCYGFEAYKATKEEYNSAHANDERLTVDGFKFGIDLMVDIVLELNKN